MCVPFPGKFQRQLQRDLGSGQYGPLIMRMPRQDGSMLPLPYGRREGYALACPCRTKMFRLVRAHTGGPGKCP